MDHTLDSTFVGGLWGTTGETDVMNDEARILKLLDDEGVLHLTLNRPHRENAFDELQSDAFASALDEARGRHAELGARRYRPSRPIQTHKSPRYAEIRP